MNNTAKVLVIIIVILLAILGYILIDNKVTTDESNTIVYVEDIGALSTGGELDHACSVWCGRVFAFSLLIVGSGVGYFYYSYKLAQVYVQVDIAEVEADAKVSQTQALTPAPKEQDDIRLIPFNTRKSVSNGNEIRLNEKLNINKGMLIEFITKSFQHPPGLAIGQWKRMGWDQMLVENLLDYMHVEGIVTERKNGRVCEYIGYEDPTEVLRKISSAT